MMDWRNLDVGRTSFEAANAIISDLKESVAKGRCQCSRIK